MGGFHGERRSLVSAGLCEMEAKEQRPITKWCPERGAYLDGPWTFVWIVTMCDMRAGSPLRLWIRARNSLAPDVCAELSQWESPIGTWTAKRVRFPELGHFDRRHEA